MWDHKKHRDAVLLKFRIQLFVLVQLKLTELCVQFWPQPVKKDKFQCLHLPEMVIRAQEGFGKCIFRDCVWKSVFHKGYTSSFPAERDNMMGQEDSTVLKLVRSGSSVSDCIEKDETSVHQRLDGSS